MCMRLIILFWGFELISPSKQYYHVPHTLTETAKRQIEERMESLQLELKERQREFEEKESELNWVYKQKLEQASGETAEKVEILRVQEEKMSRLQVELVEAIKRGEEKDLEIYRKGDEIRYIREFG